MKNDHDKETPLKKEKFDADAANDDEMTLILIQAVAKWSQAKAASDANVVDRQEPAYKHNHN